MVSARGAVMTDSGWKMEDGKKLKTETLKG
jgi:hypothetical protein